MHGASGWYFVVGKQLQWGYTSTAAATFPISFANAPYVALATEYVSYSVNGNTFLPSGASKTQITFWNTERAKRYIVLGS